MPLHIDFGVGLHHARARHKQACLAFLLCIHTAKRARLWWSQHGPKYWCVVLMQTDIACLTCSGRQLTSRANIANIASFVQMNITKGQAVERVRASTLDSRAKGQLVHYIVTRTDADWAMESANMNANWDNDMAAGYLEACMQRASGENCHICPPSTHYAAVRSPLV